MGNLFLKVIGCFPEKLLTRKGETLTYRCQIKFPEMISYPWKNSETVETLMKEISSFATPKEIEALIKLKSYWYSSGSDGVIKFVATNSSITKDVEKYFDMVASNNPKHLIRYKK